jgi:hypothetical protein
MIPGNRGAGQEYFPAQNNVNRDLTFPAGIIILNLLKNCRDMGGGEEGEKSLTFFLDKESNQDKINNLIFPEAAGAVEL